MIAAYLTLMVAGLGAANGSVVMVENGLFVGPISRNTGSSVTHAAIVLDGYVYEAMWPQVRRMPEGDYYRWLEERRRLWNARGRNMQWWVLEPQIAYGADELAAMRRYAVQELGRRYMMRGYWTARRVRGIHCSEYVGNILAHSGRLRAGGPRESPGSLFAKVAPLYATRGSVVAVVAAEKP